MRKTMQSCAVLAATVLLSASIGFAQGGDVYKAKCASCHGATGVPNPAMAKAMGIKPASDPAVKGKSEAQTIAVTANGAGKMPSYKGKLTDAQIKAAVDYFRTLAK